MADDIVNSLRSSAQWIQEVEHESWLGTAELQREAAAEIERLRAREQDLRMHAEQDACEIERLRAAGDALAEALDWNLSCPCNDERLDGLDAEMNTRSLTAQRAWQEARRG